MLKANSFRTTVALLTLLCVFAPVAAAFACSCISADSPASGCCAHPTGCPCCANAPDPGARLCASACNAPVLVFAAGASDASDSVTQGSAIPAGLPASAMPAPRPADRHGTALPRASSDPPLYLLAHALLR